MAPERPSESIENRFVVAIAQMRCHPGEVSWNFDRASTLTREAAARGARYVCLPESCLDGYPCDPEVLKRVAEPVPGEHSEGFARLSRETGTYLVAGLTESCAGKIYNTVILTTPEGRIAGHYRKTHLCTRAEDDERHLYNPGERFVVADCNGLRAGLLICYDRQFPEAARILKLRGAQVLFLPAATTSFTGEENKDFNTALLRTRAYENHLFLCAVNMVNHGGGSLFIDPCGRIRAKAGAEEELLLCEGSTQEIEEAERRNHDFVRARRPDLYGELAEVKARRNRESEHRP
jgi:predicted amidohydrolase